MYSALEKMVLVIEYRVSLAPTERERNIVYNNWLLDIPKMLEIAAIYGESNPEIVKKIIVNIYGAISDYDGDTLDFFKDMEDHSILSGGDRYINIDFTAKSLSKKNYGSR